MRSRVFSTALATAVVLACLAPFGCSGSIAPNAPAPDAPIEDVSSPTKQPFDVAQPPPDRIEPPSHCFQEPDMSTWTPTWKPSFPFATGICSTFDPNADNTTCDAVNNAKANEPCANCVLTPDVAKALGPIIIIGQSAQINQTGCIANATGDRTTEGCAAQLHALNQCLDVACSWDLELPACEDSAYHDPYKCAEAARSTVCASYIAPAACADALLAIDGGAHDRALGDASTFLTDAIRIGTLFCAGKSDGGLDSD